VTSHRSLLWQHDFARVWWSGLISWTGNRALFVALPVHTYVQTHSTLATATVVMAGALPAVVVGPLAGVLVDRLPYRPMLVWTNVALALIVLTFLLVPGAPWWALALIGLVQSAVGQLLGPAEHALLPLLVEEDRLGEANSLNAANGSLARLIGPVLGGALLGTFSFGVVVVVDGLTYLLAAGLLAGVREPLRTRAPSGGVRSIWGQWRGGLAVVRAHPGLQAVFLVVAVVGFGEGFISTLMAPFVQEVLGGNARALGLIFSAQAVGGLLGALVAARVADRLGALRLLAVGALGSGALLLVIFNYALLYRAVWPAVVLTALAGLPFALFATAQGLALQQDSPPEARGRVFSACFALVGLTALLGMGVSGALGEPFGPLVINADALTYLLGAALAWRAVRSGRQGAP